MYPKRFPQLVWLVMITGVTGCDNVAFGGIQVELQAPEEAPRAVESSGTEAVESAAPEPLVPVSLDPLVYVVERSGGSRATILPIAQLSDGDYSPLPDTSDIPDLFERFAIDRWEAGTEFALMAQGSRVGTFIADGSTAQDRSACQLRPRGGGHVEVRPDAAGLDWFMAIPASNGARSPWMAIPGTEDARLREASLNLAQRMIPVLGVLWPPSIPDVRRDLQPFSPGGGDGSGLAVSYVYGDRLAVGPAAPRAYSLFMIAAAEEGSDRYEPLLTWHQEAVSRKAFPRFLAAHDHRDAGTPDAVLEVFGESARWYTILGARGEDWSVLYLDDCGEPASRGAIRSFP